ncbi:hypothetical protein AADG42_02115 [Ammonicoccus fulvus]|uniref:Uncharacterized protein n=1 Tax=Ammonicoccus fulvus TaxID=3138240 RepID=A0ABZ3FL85_9ACTN
MLWGVGNWVDDRFMPPEHPLVTLDVRDCLHVAEGAEPLIVPCSGEADDEDAPHYAVQALVPTSADCYRVPNSIAALTVERRVACLGPGPLQNEEPRSAAGARAGQCRSDEHALLGWRSLCGRGDREALLVFRTSDHTTDPREQCLARGVAGTDQAQATRLVDLTTTPATELPEAQIVCIGTPR